MINPKIFGMMVLVAVAAYIMTFATISQYVIAYNPGPAVDEETNLEAAKAITNQTVNGNMTGGTNSTS